MCDGRHPPREEGCNDPIDFPDLRATAINQAAKAKGTYLRDKFYRLKARRGYKRAAVAHKILVAIYHMFSHRVCYNELGDLYLDKLNKHHLTCNLIHRLGRRGYIVTLEQKAA